MTVNIGSLRRGSVQTVAGTVERITDEDEFILNDGTGRIKVDGNLANDRRLAVPQNQTVTVTGKIDNDDFELEALRITQADGTIVLDRITTNSTDSNNNALNLRNGIVKVNELARGAVQTVSGEIVRIADEDEFVLSDGTRRIRVDANLANDRRLQISQGETVTVIGRLDDDDFELQARRITKANGDTVLDRLKSSAASAGDDVLVGGKSGDRLNGGQGNDVLVGKFGKDTLIGGSGRDRFVYESVQDRGDRITDFSAPADVIDLSQIFAGAAYGSSQPFADYIKLQQIGSRTVVRIDADGDTGNQGFKQLVVLNNTSTAALSTNNFLV